MTVTEKNSPKNFPSLFKEMLKKIKQEQMERERETGTDRHLPLHTFLFVLQFFCFPFPMVLNGQPDKLYFYK